MACAPFLPVAPIAAVIEWAAGAVAWGAAAAAAPVVLHLLMRTRAKTVVFPAMRFVMAGKAGRAGRLKLKHLVLLLLRMLAIALLACALAWPSCTNTASREPVAAVFAFDNSPSMEYKADGLTRLDLARRKAAAVAAELPPGSELAVTDLARLGAPAVWQGLPAGESVFAAVKPSWSTAPLAPLVAQGLEALRGHRHARKVLYLFSDRTAHAWREPISRPQESAAAASIAIVDCAIDAEGAGAPASGDAGKAAAKPAGTGTAAPSPAAAASADRNYALVGVLPERDPVPDGEAVGLTVKVRAASDRRPVRIAVQFDGEPPAAANEFGPFRPMTDTPPAGGGDAPATGNLDERAGRFSQSGLKPGLYTGRVTLDAEDPLAADNTAFFNVTVSRPFKVVFVYGAAARAGSAEGQPHKLLAEMIEPSARPRRDRRAEVVRHIVSDNWPADLDNAGLLVLLNVGELDGERWDRIDRFVRDGGRLWIVCGDRTAAAHFAPAAARGLVSVKLTETRRAQPPAHLAASHATAPTFKIFSGPGAGDLSACEVYRFWMAEPADRDTEVWASLRSGAVSSPAVLHRKVGRGRVLLWTFGPQRSWSNMQDYVPEWPVLVQETVTELMNRHVGRGNLYPLGEPVVWQLSENLAGKEVQWGRVGVGDSLGRKFKIAVGGVADFGVPEEPGNYRVRLPTLSGVPEDAAFSVNPDPRETIMQPQSLEWIRKQFPPDLRDAVSMPTEAELETAIGPGRDEFAGHLALIMLLLLVAESYFSNRFYKEEKG